MREHLSRCVVDEPLGEDEATLLAAMEVNWSLDARNQRLAWDGKPAGEAPAVSEVAQVHSPGTPVAPVHNAEAPVNKGKASVQEGLASVREDKAPVKEDKALVQEGEALVQEGLETPAHDKHGDRDLKATKADDAAVPVWLWNNAVRAGLAEDPTARGHSEGVIDHALEVI
jgi:hypothetical protein